MTLQACADLVQRGDPDRFLCAMAAPDDARAVLFPLYAFNLEVARAPWVTAEPMIAEMRLQWWRDVVDELGKDGPVRRHEVVDAMTILRGDAVLGLDQLIAARRWDIYKDPFDDLNAFWRYIDDTCSGLLWVAARYLGAEHGFANIQAAGRVIGLARYLVAVPQLEAEGRVPLVDGRPAAIRDLAVEALNFYNKNKAQKGKAASVIRKVSIETAFAKPILQQVVRDPSRVAAGALGISEFSKRFRLLRDLV